MTQEDKDLLLRDISARVPYMTFVEPKKENDDYGRKWYIGDVSADHKQVRISYYKEKGCGCSSGMAFYNLEDVKPYLRPMSSMTEKEESEYCSLKLEVSAGRLLVPSYNTIDWLNSHHFDYRGLIEKGLALEPPKYMYEID